MTHHGSPAPPRSRTKTAGASQLTESQRSDRLNSRPPRPNSPEFGSSLDPTSPFSLDATEPFPPELFRVPVPNGLFDQPLSEAALRCALALYGLSVRYVPAAERTGEDTGSTEDIGAAENIGSAAGQDSPADLPGTWTCPERLFSRAAIQAAAGLGATATRSGLEALEAEGWVDVDRSGSAHQYRWTPGVPTECFTQVPTRLVGQLPALPTGTAFDVIWQVLRLTWGWTYQAPNAAQDNGWGPRVHRRWTQISVKALAARCGRSGKSVRQVLQRLNGQWIETHTLAGQASTYRLLPEALVEALSTPGGQDRTSEERRAHDGPCVTPFSGGDAREVPPDRPRSSPPIKEPSKDPKENKHCVDAKFEREAPFHSDRRDVCSRDSNPESSKRRTSRSSGSEVTNEWCLRQLPAVKHPAYRHLRNVGIQPKIALELTHRFSLKHLRRAWGYFQSQRARQQMTNPAGWLVQAIRQDYAGQAKQREVDAQANSPEPLPQPVHKRRYDVETVDAYVSAGHDRSAFLRAAGSQEGKPFMYFAPDEGGPGASRARPLLDC